MTTSDGCADCARHLEGNPNIIGAAASVGIEHGLSTWEAVQVFMDGWHTREGHQ